MKPSERITQLYTIARGGFWLGGKIEDPDLFIRCIMAYLDEKANSNLTIATVNDPNAK